MKKALFALICSLIIVGLVCCDDNHYIDMGEQTLLGVYYTGNTYPFIDNKDASACFIMTEGSKEYLLTGYKGVMILYNYYKDTLYSNTFSNSFYPYNVPVWDGDTIIITGRVSVYEYKNKEYYLLGGQSYVDIVGRGEKYYYNINRELEYQKNHPEEYE